MRPRAPLHAMQWLVLLYSLLARGGGAAPARAEHELVEALRRQLMANNYDYMEGSESDQLTTAPPRRGGGARAAGDERDDDLDEEYRLHLGPLAHGADAEEEHDHSRELLLRREQDVEDAQEPSEDFLRTAAHVRSSTWSAPSRRAGPPREAAAIAVDRRDLLYYVDHDHLDNNILGQFDADTAERGRDRGEGRQRDRDRDWDRGQDRDQDQQLDRNDGETSPRYKLLEVRGPPGRRSAGVRRFLQEEAPGHISILNLGDGPFPEFRLPRSRRQYMENDMDYFDHDSDLEDPTPRPARRQRAPVPRSQEETSPTTKGFTLSMSAEDTLQYMAQ